jgi:hypothetical protein
MRAVLALILGMLIWGGACLPVAADTAGGAQNTVSAADEEEFRKAIAAQIEALRAGDAPAAFAFASPGIQAKFGSPAVFMDMVRGGYAALVDPQALSFGGVTDALGYPTQLAVVVDRQGRSWTALYAFERQPDGAWRISGCVLKRLDEVS